MKRATRSRLRVALFVALCVAAGAALTLVAVRPREHAASVAATGILSAVPPLAASSTPQQTVPGAAAPTPSPSPSVARPPTVRDFIPYGTVRRRQMAAYSLRHYGASSWRLRPRLIVLHYTAGPTYAGARAVFAANTPNRGELPGVAAHFVVDKDGTIYQLVPLYVRVRHAIGLNDRALAIEMVQEAGAGAGAGASWADAQILARKAQMRAALRLVRYLRARFDIRLRDVIGHAMANDSPYFHDLLGWRNDHTDWQARDVRLFRERLATLH